MGEPLKSNTFARELFRRIKAKVGELISGVASLQAVTDGLSSHLTQLQNQKSNTEPGQAFLETMSRMEFLETLEGKLEKLSKKISAGYPVYTKALIADARSAFIAVADVIDCYNATNECPDCEAKIGGVLLSPNLFIDSFVAAGGVFSAERVNTREKAHALANAIDKHWETRCTDTPAMRRELETWLKTSLSSYKNIRRDQKAFVYTFASDYFSPNQNSSIGFEQVSLMEGFNRRATEEIHVSLRAILKNTPFGMKAIRKEAEKLLSEFNLSAPALPSGKAPLLKAHPQHSMG